MISHSLRRAWRVYRRVTPVLDRCFLWGSVAAVLLLIGCLAASGTPAARTFASLLLLDVIAIVFGFALLLCLTGYVLYGMLARRMPLVGASAFAACLIGASALVYLIVLIVGVAWTPVMNWAGYP